jgi:FkbM family methyltransferase
MKNLQIYKDLYKDDRFFKEIFISEIYKAVFDKKKDVVIDIGALAGEFSFWINGGEVYAIEPEEDSYLELESNIDEFGFNVKPYKLAIAKENGTRILDTRNGTRGGSTLGGEIGQTVQTKTLATFMNDNNILNVDILKIDVEGAELEIFNAPDFKEVVDSIKCIIGEHLQGVSDLLEGYGFKVTDCGSNLLFER